MGGVLQPSANFPYLKRPILRTEVAIRELRYFVSGARLLDLVQFSLHSFVETGIRFRRLAHLVLSSRKAEPMKPAQVVISLRGALPSLKMKRSRGTFWDQLDNQSADRLWFMFSGGAGQSVCPFKSIRTLDSHFPILTSPRSSNGHSPVPSHRSVILPNRTCSFSCANW